MDIWGSLLLAQGDAVLDAADKGLSLLERVQAGGVLLLSLVIATICGVGFYFQLKANKTQSSEALAKSEAREAEAKAHTKQRLTDQETLLREMLERDREAQEAQMATIQAVQGFSHSMGELRTAVEASNRKMVDTLEKIKGLEETVRRLRDA